MTRFIDDMGNRVKLGNYVMGKTLGVGSFGKVKLAEHVLTNQLVAIKIISRSRIKYMGVAGKIKREVRILQRFTHPHIIRLYDVIETPSDIFLVLEYGSGGELFDYIVSQGKLPEDEARKYFQQIVSGVAYCHEHGIAHRDLKPENLLLTEENNIKVADFGLSNFMEDGQFLRTSCGSPNYAAPEVISGFYYAGPEIDVWSVGIILYALLCGMLPFDDDDIPKLFKKIRSGMYNMPSHLSADAQDIVSRLLLVEPLKRLTVPEIIDHPWFQEKLPKYLALPVRQQGTIKSFNTEGEVDEEIVNKICQRTDIRFIKKCGRKGVIKAIQSNKCNDIKTIYNLENDIKQKRLRDQLEFQKFSNAFEEKRTNKKPRKPSFDDSGMMVTNTNSQPTELTPDIMQLDIDQELMLDQRSRSAHVDVLLSGKMPSSNAAVGTGPFSRPMTASHHHRRPSLARLHVDNVRKRRWYLGIQSKKEPEVVIREVFRVLASLGCEWTYSDSIPYRITCRLENLYATEESKRWINLRLQLYRVQSSIYLLDFQRYGNGCSSFRFLQLCAQIINRLKPPAAPRRSQQRSQPG